MIIPILKGIVVSTLVKNASKGLNKKNDDEIAQDIVQAILNDPVAKNQLNLEKPTQSRVGIGATVAAIAVVIPPILNYVFGININEAEVLKYADNLLILWGAVYALYGRFWPNLKPLGGK